jgi:hypothetical protein
MLEHPEVGCGKCCYMRYDSFHDERWCDHDPPPEGLCSRLVVFPYHKCEYFTGDT